MTRTIASFACLLACCARGSVYEEPPGEGVRDAGAARPGHFTPPGRDPRSDPGGDADAAEDPDGGPEADPDSGSGPDGDTDSDSDSDTESETESESGGGWGGDSDTDADSDADAVIPADWTCCEWWYADGECDCGCGVADPDCAPGCTEDLCCEEADFGCDWCWASEPC
jgi:hypothetical protein